jgi:hypothetical protein
LTDGPWTFPEARSHLREASANQAAVENLIREAFRKFAVSEERYRVALAEEIVRSHNDEEVAWSTAPELARGNPRVATLRRERDVAEGMKEATLQLAWRRVADRKDAQRFADWSMRRELAEFHGETPEAAVP